MKYVDTDKIVIERSNKKVVLNIVTKKHYANTWTASSDIYAIYYKSGEHRFFDGKELKLIGCVIYGNPVGFRVVKSISEDLTDTDVLELKTMRGKFWFVPPGETIVRHKHRVQEEIYYQIKGPGKILFGKSGEEVVEVSEGSIVSVPPETWRQVVNDTDMEHIWLIIGSPAVDKDGIH